MQEHPEGRRRPLRLDDDRLDAGTGRRDGRRPLPLQGLGRLRRRGGGPCGSRTGARRRRPPHSRGRRLTAAVVLYRRAADAILVVVAEDEEAAGGGTPVVPALPRARRLGRNLAALVVR